MSPDAGQEWRIDAVIFAPENPPAYKYIVVALGAVVAACKTRADADRILADHNAALLLAEAREAIRKVLDEWVWFDKEGKRSCNGVHRVHALCALYDSLSGKGEG